MVENLFLIIETCTTEASVALCRGNQLLGEHVSKNPKSHSEYLNQAIDALMLENKVSYQDLNFIAVDKGPGSFTGIRVGLGVAKTLAYVLKIPLVEFTTTEALALSLPLVSSGRTLAIINAYKNMVFLGIYQTDFTQAEFEQLAPSLVLVENVAKFLEPNLNIVGDGCLAYPELKDSINNYANSNFGPVYPKASALLPLVKFRFEINQTKVWNSLLPLYLKASEAEENLKKGLLKFGRQI